MHLFTKVTMLAAVGAMAAACGDSATGTGTPQAVVSLNLATRAGSTSAIRTASLVDPLTLTDGTNTLVLDQVQLVLREIELKSSTPTCSNTDAGEDGEDADDDGTDDQGSGPEAGDDHGSGIRVAHLSDGDDDHCGELEIGPVLVDLPLGAGASRVLTVEVPAGTYDRVEYKIHAPRSDRDSAFVAANPEFANVSIKVTGSYNGTPFTYLTSLEKEQENRLDPPLVVGAAGPTDLTLLLDVDKWFRTAGGTLVDPATANAGQANEALVRTNIGGTGECFEDDDRDGRHD